MVLLACAAPPAPAQAPSGPDGAAGPDAPPAAPVVVMPELPPPPSDFSSSSGGGYYSDRRRTLIDGIFETAAPHKIYFPPNPPPLGVEILPGATAVDRPMLAPAELRFFVMDPFYAPLSTRFGERSVNRRQEEFLSLYRKRRLEQLEALRAVLRRYAGADPETRRRGLEAFAAGQTPALATLEEEADRFRHDLYASGLFSDGAGDWYALRAWKLGRGELDQPRAATRYFEFQVMRAAAFYQDELLPAQRRLLREVAMELEDEVFNRSDAAGGAAGWFSFFSPHLARLHWPDDLPAGLREQLRIYDDEKRALKRELQDAIYELDRVVFAVARDRALAELAQRQAPRLAGLDGLAEDIRRELVRQGVTVAAGEAPAELPPELERHIAGYQQEKEALQRALSDRVRAAVRTLDAPLPEATPEMVRDWNERRTDLAEAETARFEKDNEERLRALDARLETIRGEIQGVAGVGATVGSGAGFDSFLTEFLTRRKQQASNHEYRLALLEPGLSPEQRRLLFAAAVTALELPLPGPETQATTTPGTLLK